MAITKIVDLQVNSNIDQTTQDVKQLNTAIQSVDKSADKVGTSLNKAGAAGNSFGAIKNMVTELNPALAGAEKGFGAVLTQMWAMVANPIGAVIAALVLGLTALYKAFTSTDEGADKLEQMMSGLSNVMVVIRDRFLKFGEALAKFFSGDFSGAVKDAKSAISGVGDEIAAEFKKGAEAARLLQEVGDAMRDLKVARAELNKNLAESKELLSDENATYAQKKKAIEEIRKGEAEYTKDALENARKRLRAAQLDRKASADERADAIADAKTEILNLETESAQILRSANKQQKQLNAQMAADQKAAQDAELARQKAILDERSTYLKGTLEYEDSLLKASYKSRQIADENELKWISAKIKAKGDKDIEAANTRAATNLTIANSEKFSFDQRLAAVASREEMESQMVFKSEADRTKFKEENAAARMAIDKAETAAKMQMLNAIGTSLNTAADLAGKNTSAGKALAIAATTIDTIQSGVSAFKGMVAAVPGPVGIGLGVVAAAGALASGIASVKKIVAVKVPGGGGGSAPSVGSAPTAGGSAVPNFNVVGNSGVNQLAGIMATKDQTPVKAYVVPSDVTTGQSLDRNIIRNASLG
jgi:hypothetical protein